MVTQYLCHWVRKLGSAALCLQQSLQPTPLAYQLKILSPVLTQILQLTAQVKNTPFIHVPGGCDQQLDLLGERFQFTRGSETGLQACLVWG